MLGSANGRISDLKKQEEREMWAWKRSVIVVESSSPRFSVTAASLATRDLALLCDDKIPFS